MENNDFTMRPIAHISNDFVTKFGLPRQSGLAPSLMSTIVFEPEYRVDEALRGIEGFSHLWLIWIFDQAVRKDWSPTVRPPRLGGNTHMGVFATRSPFRPNPIGLTCVKLCQVKKTADKGTVLVVSGADMMNGTPILDIKPYLPYADWAENATGGFTDSTSTHLLEVEIPQEQANKVNPEKLETLRQVLSQDPRPAYQNSPQRIYGFQYGEYEIRFRVEGKRLTVISAEEKNDGLSGENKQ